MRAGRIQVSMALLANLLNLPEGSKIIRVSDSNVSYVQAFEIIVRHPSLPEAVEGAMIPEVGFTVTRETHLGTFHVNE